MRQLRDDEDYWLWGYLDQYDVDSWLMLVFGLSCLFFGLVLASMFFAIIFR